MRMTWKPLLRALKTTRKPARLGMWFAPTAHPAAVPPRTRPVATTCASPRSRPLSANARANLEAETLQTSRIRLARANAKLNAAFQGLSEHNHDLKETLHQNMAKSRVLEQRLYAPDEGFRALSIRAQKAEAEADHLKAQLSRANETNFKLQEQVVRLQQQCGAAKAGEARWRAEVERLTSHHRASRLALLLKSAKSNYDREETESDALAIREWATEVLDAKAVNPRAEPGYEEMFVVEERVDMNPAWRDDNNFAFNAEGGADVFARVDLEKPPGTWRDPAYEREESR